MHKLYLTIILSIACSMVHGQVQTLEKESSKQAYYSESTPYQPRKFNPVLGKAKKEKKSKKESDENNQTQSAVKFSAGDVFKKTVKIPVFVYDEKGNPVTDLQTSDFKILIDETEREIQAFDTVRKPRNLLLILDTSPSTAFDKKGIRNFAAKLIEALKPDDKLQIIEFSNRVTVLNDEPTGDQKILKKAVKKIETGEGTSLYEAIERIFQKSIDPANEPTTVILLTDGVDTTSLRADYISSLVEAEKSDKPIFPFYFDTSGYFQKNNPRFPISVGGLNSRRQIGLSKLEYDLGRMYLQDIAALSGGRAFGVKNLEEIKTPEVEEILTFLQPQYYISINPAETGKIFQRKQIKVRINRPNLIVQARGSYIVGENR